MDCIHNEKIKMDESLKEKMDMENNYNGNGSFSRGGGGQGYGQRPQIEYPLPVKIDRFYDDKGDVKKDLFDKTALEVAKSLGSKEVRLGVSSTQLRRFFDEVKRYDRLLSMQNQSWEKQKPYIRMLKSKIAYSVARVKKGSDKPYYKNLSEFVNSCIDCVEEKDDYHVFTSLFEAVYGFYYEIAPKD